MCRDRLSMAGGGVQTTPPKLSNPVCSGVFSEIASLQSKNSCSIHPKQNVVFPSSNILEFLEDSEYAFDLQEANRPASSSAERSFSEQSVISSIFILGSDDCDGNSSTVLASRLSRRASSLVQRRRKEPKPRSAGALRWAVGSRGHNAWQIICRLTEQVRNPKA